MAAIITDDFRRNSATFLIKDIIDKNAGSDDDNTLDPGGFEYFVGIGKSDPWDSQTIGETVLNENDQNFPTPLPNGSVSESQEVLDNLIGAVAVKTTNALHVIPRVNWVANRRYKRWNKYDPDMFNVSTNAGGDTEFPCYAVYNDKIYICLDNNSDTSYSTNGTYLAGPSQTTPSGDKDNRSPSSSSGSTNDNYNWVYVADLIVASEFNTDQFVEIKTTETAGSEAPENFSGGILYGFEIENPGAGLEVSNNDVAFQLVMSDATYKDPKIFDCQATIVNGAVQSFRCDGISDVSEMIVNKGIVRASIRATSALTSTTAPIIHPLISPINGFGKNPVADLPAFYAGLAVDFNGDVKGEIPTGVSYRQISLIRQPTRNASDDTSDAAIAAAAAGDGDYGLQEVLSGLRRITVDASATENQLNAITSGDIITETTADADYDPTSISGASTSNYVKAKAFVDYVDVTNRHIYFHQNDSANINYNDFTDGDGSTTKITIGETEFTYTSDSNVTPELTPRTGEVLFLENRKPIQRAASQEEEIKLVIQF
jgi:hypothetical protein